MTLDSRAFRNALGCFATGVTVVTTVTERGDPAGVTINSFSSVSLDPPLVLFCLGRLSQLYQPFIGSRVFAINVLAADQCALSVRFAAQDRRERWRGIAYHQSDSGCPLLDGCLAHLDCTTEAVHEGGDHIILVGRVRHLDWNGSGKPLLFYRGRYAALGQPVTPSAPGRDTAEPLVAE
ncbi:MAG: flavin reductase [Azospirillum sp.]|nr:flavin reductase [Azospirillum sp.]